MKFCMHIPYGYPNVEYILIFENLNYFSLYNNFSGLDLEKFWGVSPCRISNSCSLMKLSLFKEKVLISQIKSLRRKKKRPSDAINTKKQ